MVTIIASIVLFIALFTLMMGMLNLITQSINVIINKTKRDINYRFINIRLSWAFYFII